MPILISKMKGYIRLLSDKSLRYNINLPALKSVLFSNKRNLRLVVAYCLQHC